MRALDVSARFDAAADHHAEHEHHADDHRSAEEQVEDLPTVEADLDLVLVQLGLARHATSVGNVARSRKLSADNCSFEQVSHSSVLTADWFCASTRNTLPRVDGIVIDVDRKSPSSTIQTLWVGPVMALTG